MTTLKRHVVEWLSEEIDPHLVGMRRTFGLSVPESHRLVNDLLGGGRDAVVSNLIPCVFDLIEEERTVEARG